jgi:hypothetical protein
MYMSLLQHTPHTGKCYAVFDVGASSIGVALGVQRDTTITTLWSARLPYGYGREYGEYDHYVKNMLATLLEAGMSMLHDGLRIAQRDPAFTIRELQVVGVLGPPWFLGSVRHAVCTFDSRRPVMHGKLDELRSAMYSAVLESSEHEAWQTVAGPGELLEQSDIALHLDGYRIVRQRQYDATDVRLSMYLAIAPQHIIANVRDIILRIFPNHLVRMTTSTKLLSDYCLAQQKEGNRELLVEIEGQVTSIAFLEEGMLKGVVTVPVGVHALFRQVAPRAKTFKEAQSVCLVLLHDTREGEVPKKMQEALTAWQERVHEAIQEACGGVTPPAAAVMVVPPAWYSMYATTFGEPWRQPGIQENRGYTVISLTAQKALAKDGDTTLGSSGDIRLQTLLSAVDGVGVHVQG